MHHPQDIRLAIAMPPSTMMRMMATGVSHARMLVWSELAPVKKGDACPKASSGKAIAAQNAMIAIITRPQDLEESIIRPCSSSSRAA
jgi:hypothetical protein